MKNTNIVHFEGTIADLSKLRKSRFIIQPGEEVQITIKPLDEPKKTAKKKPVKA